MLTRTRTRTRTTMTMAMTMTMKVDFTNRIIMWVFIILLLLLLSNNNMPSGVNGELVCTSTIDCEKKLRFGSKCMNGKCSNPFIKGCLNTMIEEQEAADNDDDDAIASLLKNKIQDRLGLLSLQSLHIRICNSDDDKRIAAAAAAAADPSSTKSSSSSARKLEYLTIEAAVDVPTWVNTDFNNNNNPSHDDDNDADDDEQQIRHHHDDDAADFESPRNYEYFNSTTINSNDNDNDNLELDEIELDEADDESDDESDVEFDDEFCIPNYLEYPEIRIHDSNWESSIFIAWIMQIILMEILNVPVSVGLNSIVTDKTSFYSSSNTLQYSTSAYPWDAVERSTSTNSTGDVNFVDCTETNDDCVHVLTEVWNGQVNEWERGIQEGYIEPVDGGGQVGKLGWYVSSQTAQSDSTLTNFYGLRGEQNRQKLATVFQKPNTWMEYCELYSINNCTLPYDEIAPGGYPNVDDGDDGSIYYKEGSYNGYFQSPSESYDCTLYPTTCTGYMISPPCTWSGNADAQVYWNDIVGLKLDGPMITNGGYGYSNMIQIWKAANATKSDVMMWWWQPESLLEEFSDSDTHSFQLVLLPTATDVCYAARISSEDRCSDDITTRRGDSMGACDNEAHALQKIISSSLGKQNMMLPPVSRSPGYEFIRSLKITDLEMQNLFKRWKKLNVDPYGNDAREAVCTWVVDNIDRLLDFIPQGYPRVLDTTSSYKEGYLYAATVVAVLCAIIITVISGLVYYWRLTKVFVYAQELFVRIILFGFGLVCIGALLFSLEPSSFTCSARIWFTTVGYNIELAAILIKISAINRIMQSSMKLKRVNVSRQAMYGSLSFLVILAVCYLIAWTVVSPPEAIENRVLPDEYSTTIEVSIMCQSKQVYWEYLSLAWQLLLLLVASVLAFQSRDTISDFNESRSFGTMIYSHFLFMILRIIVFYLGSQELLQPNVIGACLSFLLSFDVLFATAIYVVPKCLQAQKAPEVYNPRRRSSLSQAASDVEDRSGEFRSREFRRREFYSTVGRKSKTKRDNSRGRSCKSLEFTLSAAEADTMMNDISSKSSKDILNGSSNGNECPSSPHSTSSQRSTDPIQKVDDMMPPLFEKQFDYTEGTKS